MTKPLLFLGAGASYGSEAEGGLPVPPLTKDLFNELARFEPPVWTKLPADMQAKFRADFEGGMLALAEALPHALTVAQRSMAAFFYRYGPSPRSVYVRLADRVRSSGWQGAIGTLNYERMLHLALGQRGLRATVGERGGLELCFPHGCCHLFCESVKGGAAVVSMAGMNVQTDGSVAALDHPDQFWPRIRGDAFPPVMSYFEPSKYTLSGASFIASQRARMQKLITEAQVLAIVGIHVREQDEHIWGALAKTDARIMYCSGREGARVFSEWKQRTRPAKAAHDTVLAGYWADGFDQTCTHLGIA